MGRGGRAHPSYFSWYHMMKRCHDPKYPRYADWGGRGIRVCERWHVFANFVTDMGAKEKGMSIDRIDNDGNYEPGNCRWTTPHQQSLNTKRSLRLFVDGKPTSLRQLAINSPVTEATIKRRIHAGWTIDMAVTTPPKTPGNRKRNGKEPK